jgi:hypothetical protein
LIQQQSKTRLFIEIQIRLQQHKAAEDDSLMRGKEPKPSGDVARK